MPTRKPEPDEPGTVAGRAADRIDDDPIQEPEPESTTATEAELDERERELALRERELALEARERELVAREAAAAGEVAAAQGDPGLPEYLLTLANGETVEAANALATHHTGADGLPWSVVLAIPIPGKWGVPYAKHPDNPDNLSRAQKQRVS